MFYTGSKTPRPIRLSENTRKFAFDSLNYKYGLDTKKNMSVTLDHIENFDFFSPLEKYNAAIYEIASNSPIRLCENELLSGAATLGLATTHLVPATYKAEAVCQSVSHVTLGFDKVVFNGLISYYDEIQKSLEKNTDPEKAELLNSMKHCIKCFELWHSRYLSALGSGKIYENLKRVPMYPAQNFYEAVQSLWMIFAFTRLCGNWPGIGRIDYILGNFLKNDLKSGAITLDNAREILAHFFIKGCEWISGEFDGGSGDAQHYQNIVLSGVDQNGIDITNEVTYLVLDIVEETGISDFPIAVRLNPLSPALLKKRVSEVISHGGGIVAVYNENLIIESLVDFGYDLNEARLFANDGCWEVQIPGKTYFSYYPFDALQILQNRTLKNSYDDYESLYNAFISDMKCEVDDIYKYVTSCYDIKAKKWNKALACPLISLLTENCIESGMSYFEGGAKYIMRSPHIGGIADVVNSLYAIKNAVFIEKRFTFDEFMNIVKKNWQDNEILREDMMTKYTYFGNDNDEVDTIASSILSEFADYVHKYNGETPIMFIPGVSTFGRQIEWSHKRGATPFGRKTGEILASNLSPTPSTDKNGATSIIKSYCKCDMKKLTCGAALDIKLHPSSCDGISGLINGFLALGGFFIQIDVIDNSVLLDAQIHPENYKTLAVRISGWSARFITLNSEWQKMIIERDVTNL